jgi:hypothetical protein
MIRGYIFPKNCAGGELRVASGGLRVRGLKSCGLKKSAVVGDICGKY